MYSTCEEIKLKNIGLRVYLRLYCRSLQENIIVEFYLIIKSDFASPIVIVQRNDHSCIFCVFCRNQDV